MQVDLTLVLSFLGVVFGAIASAFVALGRLAFQQHKAAQDLQVVELRRVHEAELRELKARIETIDARLHTEEKSTIRQDGEIALVKQSHLGLDSDLEEIKRNMATKNDVSQLERTLERFMAKNPSHQRFAPFHDDSKKTTP
jgi:hypothetical protein